MTNKDKKAVGIQYDQKSSPKISVKGQGLLAMEIIELAKEHDILIHQDSALTEFLSLLEVGEDIPPQLFEVIAELIAFSYLLQGKFPNHWRQDGRQHIQYTV